MMYLKFIHTESFVSLNVYVYMETNCIFSARSGYIMDNVSSSTVMM